MGRARNTEELGTSPGNSVLAVTRGEGYSLAGSYSRSVIEVSLTIPESAITAISVVPPPMSIIILPAGSCTGKPTPIAAAIGSSIR